MCARSGDEKVRQTAHVRCHGNRVPPPSATWTELATTLARYSVCQRSPPHPVARRDNPTATRNSERAPPEPSRVPVPNLQTLAGCVHALPPTLTRVASSPSLALRSAHRSDAQTGPAPRPPPARAPAAAHLLIGWRVGLTPAPPTTEI